MSFVEELGGILTCEKYFCMDFLGVHVDSIEQNIVWKQNSIVTAGEDLVHDHGVRLILYFLMFIPP